MRNVALVAGVIVCLGVCDAVRAQRDTSPSAPVPFSGSRMYAEQTAIDEDSAIVFKPVQSAIYLACIPQSDPDIDVTVPDDVPPVETPFITEDTP